MARRRRPPRSGAIAELPPLRILSQIAGLQAIYYAVALILMVFTCLVAGWPFTLDLVFGWDRLRGDTSQGWFFGFVWLCCSGAVIIALIIIVARSKLVLDFALTLHFIHLVVVVFYTGALPPHAMWWGVMAASAAITFFGGSYGCQWRELQPIFFSGIGGGTSRTTGGDAELGVGPGGMGSSVNNGGTRDDQQRLAAPGLDGDEEMGFGRGGRGRARSQNEFEMTGMKKAGDENR